MREIKNTLETVFVKSDFNQASLLRNARRLNSKSKHPKPVSTCSLNKGNYNHSHSSKDNPSLVQVHKTKRKLQVTMIATVNSSGHFL